MRALNRKLLRDLWQMKGQGLAISMVIASGIAMLITFLGAFDSLHLTRESYYERYRFADVFASLKRAPNHLVDTISEIPGVSQADARVIVNVVLDVEGLEEPATGTLISIPETDLPTLNDVALVSGRYIEGDRPDEVLASEGFCLAHGLKPGDQISAIINGRRKDLKIVGIALSPEYIYSIKPGDIFPDDTRYGIFWMGRKALSTAFDMEGGFNDVNLRLVRGASIDEAISRLDHLLEPYGGLGAIPRSQQISHWTLSSELDALKSSGVIIPAIFLLVAAFLLNVALNRIVALQREQIAALKALGHTHFEIGMHYTLWGLTLTLVGSAVGVVFGIQLGKGMVELYNMIYRFPFLEYRLQPATIVISLIVGIVAACVGAYSAVRKAVALPPAEAMRPEPPATYKISWIERLGMRMLLSPAARMVIRNMIRKPMRSMSSVIGIAFAVAIYIAGVFSLDSMDVMLDVQYNVVQRHDMMVTFVEPLSPDARFAIQRLPGVTFTESNRSVAVRIRNGHRARQTAITGMSNDAELFRVMDTSLAQVLLPKEGLVLSKKLAEVLNVKRGDVVKVEVLEGKRPIRDLVVADLVNEYLGMGAYMDENALHQFLREGDLVSSAYLQVDDLETAALYKLMKNLPRVAGASLKTAAIESFWENLGESMGKFVFFTMFFAAVIAFGVVYNAARVSLSERSRELASLRVLGFTRAEISQILLGELALVTLIGIPLGMLLGYGLAALTVHAYDTEVFRFPLAVSMKTYAVGVLNVVVSAIISGLVVRRKLDNLDLVEVLKTRE